MRVGVRRSIRQSHGERPFERERLAPRRSLGKGQGLSRKGMDNAGGFNGLPFFTHH